MRNLFVADKAPGRRGTVGFSGTVIVAARMAPPAGMNAPI
jgi:hypothetical protein